MRKLCKLAVHCLFGVSGVVYAQVIPSHETLERVGINKDNPERTLDVNGGVRLKTPGTKRNSADVYPLGIDKNNQLIIMPKTKKEASLFQKRKFRIRVSQGTKGETIKTELPIKANEYLVNVVYYKLLRRIGVDKYEKADISVLGIAETNVGNDGVWENAIGNIGFGTAGGNQQFGTKTGGWAGVVGRNNDQNPALGNPQLWWVQNNLVPDAPAHAQNQNRTFMFYAIPKVYLTVNQSGNYVVNATYLDGEDVIYNADNYWEVDFLVIKKYLGIEYEDIVGTVNGDGSITKNSGDYIVK